MARRLDSIAAHVGAELVAGRLDGSVPVDSAVPLADFAVVGHPAFATLVVGRPGELAAAIGAGDDRAAELAAAVLVTTGDTAELRAAVANADATAIVGATTPPDALLPTLVALLATDQAAEDRLVTTGTKVLTQVARRGGAKAVIAELAHRIDGWAVLVDVHGQVITTAGAGGLHVQDAIAVAFNRPVRVRHPGLQVHPVGPGEDLTAHLVIASREGSTSRSRDLASQVAALLDLVLRTHDHTGTERLGRAVMVDTLLAGGAEASALLGRWGVRERSLTAFALSSRSKAVDLERLVTRWLDELGAVHVVTEAHERVLGFLRDDHVDAFARRVDEFALDGRAVLRLGLGSSAPGDGLARSAGEARQAHEAAVADARTVVRYRSLPTVAYVLERLDGDGTARIGELLDGLRDDDGAHGELLQTLRVYLAEHGALGTTAATLGVHRQTLASRLARIEERSGLSLSSPDDRAAAWLALRALER
ncbi:helix-turn-helix domain-containing protein [Agromyces sp. H3Y2-19a]|uniref:PucR family transcriptional regulator n=1 Tax=Agromyces TaxID=33877 RepID=UPI001E37D931|nr:MULTISPECIES: helix-turn-helix domain-containing protein [Agromyces]MCD5345619.1 helix-turn-helix domain-containing protein [Agromyces sp. S2-1-8]MDF0515473.1 helix-turn-helix domain-containing protein [Agromyces chromiiresistens]